ASLSCGAKSDASRSSMVGGMCTNSSSVGGDAVGAIAASRASTSSSCAESALPEEESCATASATQITAVVSSATAAASLPIRDDVSKPDRSKVFIVNLPGRQPVGPAGSAMQPRLQSVHHPCAAPPHASAPAGLRG